MMVCKGNFLQYTIVLPNVQSIHVAKGRAEVSAIRFSPTSLPNPKELPRETKALFELTGF
jgi:hypothetical protein